MLARNTAPKPSVRPENLPTIRLVRAFNVCFCRIYHQLEVASPCQIPPTGAAILACNHTSGLDPALIQAVCHRPIIWMMAAEYYEQPAIRWFFKLVHAIPVDRGGRDLAATRMALRALHDGYVLGIFPEGRIETDTNLLPFQTGVAKLALKTGISVYPAFLDGTQRKKEMLQACFLPQSARIAFGPKIRLNRTCPDPDRHPAEPAEQTATKVLVDAIEDLRQRLVST